MPDTVPSSASLAQTYAALLDSVPRPRSASAVQIVGDKTIALSGRYSRAASGASEGASDWSAPQGRRKSAVKRKAATDAGDDAPDPEIGPSGDVAAGKDRQGPPAIKKRRSDAVAVGPAGAFDLSLCRRTSK